ncbi:formylglycine-generating enzyme family protein, partial [Candidatus Neomarinimicrobiota bacterium]
KYYGLRLPTKDEWEKAARANSMTNYPWGNTFSSSYANFKDSGDKYDNDTTPVGYYNGGGNTNDSYSPYGIYDMAGNVWEWTSSWWRDSSGKVIKGGSWESKTTTIGSDTLYVRDLLTWFEPPMGYLPTNISHEIGFRCVKDISD